MRNRNIFIHNGFCLADIKKEATLSSHFTSAEKEGFEPPVHCCTTVFKTAAIDHSAISPLQRYNFFISIIILTKKYFKYTACCYKTIIYNKK